MILTQLQWTTSDSGDSNDEGRRAISSTIAMAAPNQSPTNIRWILNAHFRPRGVKGFLGVIDLLHQVKIAKRAEV